MSKPEVISLCSVQGEEMVFLGAAIKATVRNTSIETEMVQRFKNPSARTIEVVYNFPLPINAVLLSLKLKLNGKTYVGRVLEANEAEERYENAIIDGDTPILLKQISDNLFNLNLGNLQAGDEVEIETRYVQLLTWQHDQLRLMIPTTLAPRYGNPADLGMTPEQQTGTDLLAEYRAEITVIVEGGMAQNRIESPSHEVVVQRSPDHALIKGFRNSIAMDRDFILLFHKEGTIRGTAYYDRDLHGRWIAWLSFVPALQNQVQPRHIKIVVDCSGSMGGDSIHQAKIAVREIVEQLRPCDAFNIIRFGDVAESLFKSSYVATPANVEQALSWIRHMDADMGGTEMYHALSKAYASTATGKQYDKPDVLLITDGQVSDVNHLVASAQASGHRHFTVGVGSAVSEDVVRLLAERTLGACELVSPNESMASSIVRHADRMANPRVTASKINWPSGAMPVYETQLERVYASDTVHHVAQLNEMPKGEVSIALDFEGQSWSLSMQCQPFSNHAEQGDVPLESLTLARMAAAIRIRQSKAKADRISMGVDYQLQSRETNYIIIAEREVKDDSPVGPELVKIQSMLPAGWGGTSSVIDDAISARSYRSSFNMRQNKRSVSDMDLMDLDRFMDCAKEICASREYVPMTLPCSPFDFDDQVIPHQQLIRLIKAMDGQDFNENSLSLGILRPYIGEERYQLLSQLVPDFPDEMTVLVLILYMLMQENVFKNEMPRSQRRTIAKAWKVIKNRNGISDNDEVKLQISVMQALYP